MYQRMNSDNYTISGRNMLPEEGKDLWTVKIFCDKKILSDQIDDVSKEAAFLEEMIMASPPGKAYMLQRRKTHLIKNEIERICNDFIRSCLTRFESFNYRDYITKSIPESEQAENGSLVLHADILVDQNKIAEFLIVADSVGKEIGNHWFYIETTKANAHIAVISDGNNKIVQKNSF
jgi:hypothetical protein